MSKIFTLKTFNIIIAGLFISLLLGFSTSYAQVPTVQDCLGAIPVCQDTYTQQTSYLGSGNYPNEVYNPSGDCTLDCPGSCLDGEKNSVWYIFTVQQGGNLRLTIAPFFQVDDYDWAVYDITNLRCGDIYSSYPLMQKSCNAYGSTSTNGNTGISTLQGGSGNCNHCGDAGTSKWNADLPVTAGRTYVLLIENWSQSPQGGYTLDFSASDAVIYDNVRPTLLTINADEITCGATQINIEFSENVACESVDPTDFVLSGPGGPYTILDVQGDACMVGADWEKNYTLFLDHGINEDGDYSLQLIPLSFINDACENYALGNTMTFAVSLGAPVINPANINITPATCGLTNGAVSGLSITGTPPYQYQWTNEAGDIVGTALDLANVGTGNYYFLVSDNNTCAASSGPYFVDQTGAPQVDESAMNIISATVGANNGSITGISFTGTPPLVYTWYDDLGNVIGNSLDLTSVYTGYYTLQAVDGNDCDTITGPYFVPETGGPLVALASASPQDICIGESSHLTATGNGGTGNYTYLWTSTPGSFSSDLSSPVVYPLVNTIYHVEINDGYTNSSADVTVNVNPLPLANAGIDDTIPYGTSTTLFGSASGGSSNYSYAWKPEVQLINPYTQNAPTKNIFSTTKFWLVVTDLESGCISIEDSVTVVITGGPLGVTVSPDNGSTCEGEPITLQAFGSGGNEPNYIYTWYYNQNIVQKDTATTSLFTVTPGAAGIYSYVVEIFDHFNPFYDTVNVIVTQSPQFQFTGGSEIVACPYDSVVLAPDPIYPGVHYYWSNGSEAQSIKVGTTGIGFDSKSYSLTLETSDNCQYTSDVTVYFDFAQCSGINENNKYNSIKIYPNPSPGLFTVSIEDGTNYRDLEIINPQGQVIYARELHDLRMGKNEIVINLINLPKGIYILKATNDTFISFQKLILR